MLRPLFIPDVAARLHRLRQVIAAALMVAVAQAPAFAQNATTPRYALPPLDADIAAQFPAIGRSGKGGLVTAQGCTSTLIAPTLILTAAHCTSATGQSDRAFFVGWRDGDYIATRASVLEIRHPAYGIGGVHRPQNDLALIVLDSPIDDVSPLPLGDVARTALEGTDVALLGYHAQSPDRLSGRFDCPLSYFGDGLFTVGCPVASGNSGSPILNRSQDGAWQIVGVISSTIPGAAVAVELPDWLRREVAAHQRE